MARKRTTRARKRAAATVVTADNEVEIVAEKTLDEVLADRRAAAAARGDVVELTGDTPARPRAPEAAEAAPAALESAPAADEEVQLIAVKGLEDVLADRFAAARARGDVVDLAEGTPFKPRAPDGAQQAADIVMGELPEEVAPAAAVSVKMELVVAAHARPPPASGLSHTLQAAGILPAQPLPPMPAPPRPAPTPAQLLASMPGPLRGNESTAETIVQKLARRMRMLDLEKGALAFVPHQQPQQPQQPQQLQLQQPQQPQQPQQQPQLHAELLREQLALVAQAGPRALAAVAPGAAPVLPVPPPLPPGAQPAGVQPAGVRLVRLPCAIDSARSKSVRTMLGTEVHFPFDAPLPSQTKVMVAVLRTLEQQQACLIESPTGTGKTVALLCAALAWQRKQLAAHGHAPRVYYGIRTHSQVRSVIGEFEKVPYRPAISFLASRERQCLNKEVGLQPHGGQHAAGGSAHNSQEMRNGGGGGGGGGAGRQALNQRCRAAVRAVEKARRDRLERGSWDDDKPPPVRTAEGVPCGCDHYRLMTVPEYGHRLHERARPAPRAPCEGGGGGGEGAEAGCGVAGEGSGTRAGGSAAAEGAGGGGGGGRGGQAGGGRAAGIFDIEDLAAFGRQPLGTAAAGAPCQGGDCAGGAPQQLAIGARLGDSSGRGGGDGGGGAADEGAGAEQLVLQVDLASATGVELDRCEAGALVLAAPAGSCLREGDVLTAFGVGGTPDSPGAWADGAALCDGAAPLSQVVQFGGGSAWLRVERGARGARARSALVGCPYYSSIALAAEADLVFCPYKYLVDPAIRSAMKIDVSGAILILDEAHNIEAECRDVGSATVELTRLLAALHWARDTLELARTEGRGGCGRRRQNDRDPDSIFLDAADRAEPILAALCAALVRRRALFEGRGGVADAPGCGSQDGGGWGGGASQGGGGGGGGSSWYGGGSQGSSQQPAGASQHKAQAVREAERRAKFRVAADERSLLYKWSSTMTAKALTELLTAKNVPPRAAQAAPQQPPPTQQPPAAFGPQAAPAHAPAETGALDSSLLRSAADALSEALASRESSEGAAGGGGGGGAALESAIEVLRALALCADEPSKFVVAVQVWDNKASAFPRRAPRCDASMIPTAWQCDGQIVDWGVELCVWLLAPSVTFSALAAEAHALVLTSGTLSPLGAMERELGAAFAARVHPTIRPVQAEHVVGPDQLLARVVGASAAGCALACTSEQLGRPEVGLELGVTLAQLARTAPRRGGVLVFVSSFSTARKLSALWQDRQAHAAHWQRHWGRRWHGQTVWEELQAIKALVLIESHGPNADSAEDVRAFRRAVEEGGGALCIAVYRGKLSEGISFNDDYARLVLCVGLPFPSIGDEMIRAKRAYNDLPASRADGLLSGSEWYRQQAFRALNQAIGRCIRHRNDWGAVCLVDERFAQKGERLNLSQWLLKLLPEEPTPVEVLVREASAHMLSAPTFVRERARREEAEAEARRRAAAAAAAAAEAGAPLPLAGAGSQPAAEHLARAALSPPPAGRGSAGGLEAPHGLPCSPAARGAPQQSPAPCSPAAVHWTQLTPRSDRSQPPAARPSAEQRAETTADSPPLLSAATPPRPVHEQQLVAASPPQCQAAPQSLSQPAMLAAGGASPRRALPTGAARPYAVLGAPLTSLQCPQPQHGGALMEDEIDSEITDEQHARNGLLASPAPLAPAMRAAGNVGAPSSALALMSTADAQQGRGSSSAVPEADGRSIHDASSAPPLSIGCAHDASSKLDDGPCGKPRAKRNRTKK